MGVGGVSGGGSAVAELMKILQMNQAQTLDLAKKLVKVGLAGAVGAIPEEGKGENIDVYG